MGRKAVGFKLADLPVIEPERCTIVAQSTCCISGVRAALGTVPALLHMAEDELIELPKKGKSMKGWLNNAVSFIETGDTGSCPNCGSNHVECLVTYRGRKSFSFLCKDCGSADHLDGITFQTERKLRELGLS